MIYFLLCAASSFLGFTTGLGPAFLLRPMMDVVSPLAFESVSMLCMLATLGSALTSTFFTLSQPIRIHQDEILMLTIGSAVGGVLGDLLYSRFTHMLPNNGVFLLQNALLFVLLSLPALYFHALSNSIRPLSVTRLCILPLSLFIGVFASFLCFGAIPLTLMIYFLLFDAENEEAYTAALTIALFSSAGKLIMMLIRTKFILPNAQYILFILPGAIIGTVFSMIPRLKAQFHQAAKPLLFISLYTAFLNIMRSIL